MWLFLCCFVHVVCDAVTCLLLLVICCKFVFRCEYFILSVWRFPCVFFLTCRTFVIANSCAVFVAFFLLCFLLCCFAVFALFLLSFLYLAFEFILSKFFPGVLRFPCVVFLFLALFICKIDVLLCVYLQVCLWVFPVLAQTVIYC